MIRDLIEVQGGLEMEDRRFYTGFVNDQGQRDQWNGCQVEDGGLADGEAGQAG